MQDTSIVQQGQCDHEAYGQTVNVPSHETEKIAEEHQTQYPYELCGVIRYRLLRQSVEILVHVPS